MTVPTAIILEQLLDDLVGDGKQRRRVESKNSGRTYPG
jgi:hypothetical protein